MLPSRFSSSAESNPPRPERDRLTEVLHCESPSDSLADRQAALNLFTKDLPGSQPYDNVRPLNVPRRFAGLSLLDFADQRHPQMGRAYWEQAISNGRLRYHDQPLAAETRVVEGMEIQHWIPDTLEPAVNCQIQILYQDQDWIAVHKPAPLPVHPSGRFHRNTLLWILQQVYSPETLRAVHRLDANTSGVLLLARTRQAAARIAPQFRTGKIHKTYLARVVGHPAWDEHHCREPIEDQAGVAGLRVTSSTGLPAETHFQVLHRWPDQTSLLQVRPITGRTNQIRIHLWHLNLPIVNDPGYLPQRQLGNRCSLLPDEPAMGLHAWKLQIPGIPGKEEPAEQPSVLQFEATPPTWAVVPDTPPEA